MKTLFLHLYFFTGEKIANPEKWCEEVGRKNTLEPLPVEVWHCSWLLMEENTQDILDYRVQYYLTEKSYSRDGWWNFWCFGSDVLEKESHISGKKGLFIQSLFPLLLGKGLVVEKFTDSIYYHEVFYPVHPQPLYPDLFLFFDEDFYLKEAIYMSDRIVAWNAYFTEKILAHCEFPQPKEYCSLSQAVKTLSNNLLLTWDEVKKYYQSYTQKIKNRQPVDLFVLIDLYKFYAKPIIGE